MASYHERREIVWPHEEEWGDRHERRNVRDYLKKIWEENVDTHSTKPSLENTKREKNDILEWWWRNRYTQSGPMDINSKYFGKWLYEQYLDAYKLSRRDNHKRGRN